MRHPSDFETTVRTYYPCRMWEGEQSLARGAESGALTPAGAKLLRVAGGQAVGRAQPVRADRVALTPDMSARRGFETALTAYANAINENLRCVLTETDPEGAHQLRVTLRRLRTSLRIFKPIIRRETGDRVGWVARYIGAIVGELRDADVIVEEMIGPALGPAAMPIAIATWREDVRARVRASLQAARAASFANDLLQLGESGAWRAKTPRKGPATAFVSKMLNSIQAKAAARADRMSSLTALERHELRKDLKSWRYTTELLASYDEGAAATASALKRLQTVLGELNDMHMLETQREGACVEPDVLTRWRKLLSHEHGKKAPALVDAAKFRWIELMACERAQQTPAGAP